MVSVRGIEAKPEKVETMIDMEASIKMMREIQKLTRRLAALRRFISNRSKKRYHFSKCFRGLRISRGPNCEKQYQEVTKYLNKVSLLMRDAVIVLTSM